MTPVLLRFWLDERGATAIEYCLIGGLISIAVFTGAKLIGTKLVSLYFQPVSTGLT